MKEGTGHSKEGAGGGQGIQDRNGLVGAPEVSTNTFQSLKTDQSNVNILLFLTLLISSLYCYVLY